MGITRRAIYSAIERNLWAVFASFIYLYLVNPKTDWLDPVSVGLSFANMSVNYGFGLAMLSAAAAGAMPYAIRGLFQKPIRHLVIALLSGASSIPIVAGLSIAVATYAHLSINTDTQTINFLETGHSAIKYIFMDEKDKLLLPEQNASANWVKIFQDEVSKSDLSNLNQIMHQLNQKGIIVPIKAATNEAIAQITGVIMQSLSPSATEIQKIEAYMTVILGIVSAMIMGGMLYGTLNVLRQDTKKRSPAFWDE